MKSKRNIFLIALSVLLGAVFIFSAYSKTVPNLQGFEFTISSQLHVPYEVAAWAARFFIGLEAALGMLLLTVIFGSRKWILKACLAMLVIFSIHLIILWATLGNDVDCGCMGSLVAMSPAVSLLKNAGLIIAVLILIRYYRKKEEKAHNLLAIIVILAFIVAPYFIFPIQEKPVLPLSELYTDETDQPLLDLREGKHILSFMSLTCGHCREAAKKIHEISVNNLDIPFYFVFPKSENDSLQAIAFQDFMNETNDQNIPYSFIDYEKFVKLLGIAGETGVPAIFWMNDSTIDRKITVPEINQKDMELWLNQQP